jgi:hypothetical protein
MSRRGLAWVQMNRRVSFGLDKIATIGFSLPRLFSSSLHLFSLDHHHPLSCRRLPPFFLVTLTTKTDPMHSVTRLMLKTALAFSRTHLYLPHLAPWILAGVLKHLKLGSGYTLKILG